MFSKYTIRYAFLALLLASCCLFGQTKETLFNFPGGAMGAEPFSGLVMDKSGNFYGTTFGSETLPSSSVAFKLSRTSTGWTETVLHLFTGHGDGPNPAAGVTLDGKGNIFGTTQYGGTENCTDGYGFRCGTVYEISPNGSGGWNEQVLYSFPSTGATNPIGGLILDPMGNLYGTAWIGGNSCPAHYVGCGSVFKLAHRADRWTLKTLHDFSWTPSHPDGAVPLGSLFEDAQHNLYGITEAGGTADVGSVFELSPEMTGLYSTSLIASFQATGGSGFQPSGALIRDKQGNFYGTTSFGGAVNSTCSPNGCGTVFELSPGASGWELQTLYSFQGGTDGMLPVNTTLALDAKGNLYGVTNYGGNNTCNCGVVYELSPLTGGGWNEKVLYAFQGGTDGGFPTGTIVVDAGGNVYGTTPTGGVNNAGTVFKIAP